MNCLVKSIRENIHICECPVKYIPFVTKKITGNMTRFGTKLKMANPVKEICNLALETTVFIIKSGLGCAKIVSSPPDVLSGSKS